MERVGDYLAVMPINPLRDVKRVLTRFGIPADSSVVVKSRKRTFLVRVKVGVRVRSPDILTFPLDSLTTP